MPSGFFGARHRRRACRAAGGNHYRHVICLAHRHRLLRTKGVYFIMITLAFGQMVYFLATSLAPYGGDNGLTIAARNTVAGFALMKNDRAFYYVALLCLLATYLFCRALVASRFGRVLRGGKENAVRMAAIGFTVQRFQLIAYVIAGGLGGVVGLLARQLGRIRQRRPICRGSNPAN